MAGIAFVSQNRIYFLDGGRITEIPCGRLEKYREALAGIRRRTEWKTTGTGAKFMGQTGMPADDESNIYAQIGGIACYDGRLVYGIRLDESGSIYIRSLDPSDTDENLVVSGKEIFPGRMSCLDNILAVSCGANDLEMHISAYELPSSVCLEYTDGDSIEEAPSFDGKNRIYFSTAGYARDGAGRIAAVQNKSIVCLDTARCVMDEVISDEKYDYLYPKSDGCGGLYAVRRTAGGERTGDGGNILLDIIKLPYRLIKALAGLLNMFSIIFGGESLKSGGKSDAKAKQQDRKQLFIDGNIVNAEKNMQEAQRRGEKYPGIMPQSSVLVHIGPDGKEDIILRGVLDYTLLADGNLAVSNGSHIMICGIDGSEISAVKADRAVCLTEII